MQTCSVCRWTQILQCMDNVIVILCIFVVACELKKKRIHRNASLVLFSLHTPTQSQLDCVPPTFAYWPFLRCRKHIIKKKIWFNVHVGSYRAFSDAVFVCWVCPSFLRRLNSRQPPWFVYSTIPSFKHFCWHSCYLPWAFTCFERSRRTCVCPDVQCR